VEVDCSTVTRIKPSLRLPVRAALTAGALLLATGSVLVAQTGEKPLFVERAAQWGIDFVHTNGMSGKFYYPEIMGGGGGLVDYDGDGDLDVYLVQGGSLRPDGAGETAGVEAGSQAVRDRLFRNDPVPGSPDGSAPFTPRFVDVTDASGIAGIDYGTGIAAGDVDGDGWTDLYVTEYGPNKLWRNRGDGTFEDVTAAAGVEDPRWSTAATFVDVDRDGRLDLFEVAYVVVDLAANPRCFTASSRRDYCGPADFKPLPDRLWHNRTERPGAVTFEDVSNSSGIGREPGPGLGVLAADLDGDGWTDLYVTNDGAANFLWHNLGGAGKGGIAFEDDALLSGVALNRDGEPEGSMGVDAGDFDADGDLDLFMTHIKGETNTLYVNDGGGLFSDRTVEKGLGAPSFPYTGFGTAWFDYDNDGWLDLLVLNGEVRTIEPLAREGDPFPFEQRNQLYRNLGGKRFEEVTGRAGPAFDLTEVSRGAAFGDVDDDGAVDALVVNLNGPARLLVNRAAGDTPWLGLVFRDGAGGAAPLGTRIEVDRRGAPTLIRRVRADGSFASAADPRVVVGLGEAPLSEVRLRWPDGKERHLRGLQTGRWWVVPEPEKRTER